MPQQRVGHVSEPEASKAPEGERAAQRLLAIWPAWTLTGKVRHVELKVSIRSQGGRTIMSVGGEIDLYTAPRLHGELVTALAGGGPEQIVVDMSGVEFCDSTGRNVLLAADRRAREEGGDEGVRARCAGRWRT